MRPVSPSPDTSPRSSSGAPERLATALVVASHLHFVVTQIKLSNVVRARARCGAPATALGLLPIRRQLAELASGSDAQMNTLLVNVSELSAAQRRGIVVGNGAGGRGAGGRGAGVAAGRGMAGRGAVGHGAVGRDAGHAGAGAASRARCCTVCKQPGHNRTTCRSSLRDLGVVGDDEPLVLPHAPALPSDSDNDALPSAPPLEPSIAPPAAPPSAPQPTPQPAPQPQSAPTRAGDGGSATVTINVGTLTSLVGHGGSFSLDDLVGAGGVELPHAPAPVANPQVLRGKGRPKVVRYKSSRELKKRKRNAS